MIAAGSRIKWEPLGCVVLSCVARAEQRRQTVEAQRSIGRIAFVCGSRVIGRISEATQRVGTGRRSFAASRRPWPGPAAVLGLRSQRQGNSALGSEGYIQVKMEAHSGMYYTMVAACSQRLALYAR